MFTGKLSRTTTIHPGIFLGRELWADGVSPRMNTVDSRNHFKPIRMGDNLVVNSMSTYNHRLYFARFRAGSTPKIANKSIQLRTLPGFLIIPSVSFVQIEELSLFQKHRRTLRILMNDVAFPSLAKVST